MKKSVLYLGLLISACHASDGLEQLEALAERDQRLVVKKQPLGSALLAVQAWENQRECALEELPTVDAEHAGSPTTPHAPSEPIKINSGVENPAGFSYKMTSFGNPSDPEFMKMIKAQNSNQSEALTPCETPNITPVSSGRQSPTDVFFMDDEDNYNQKEK